jgi:N-dimethylarginine dimethylaminohydrolase
LGALSRGVALAYEPAFEPKSLAKIREAYPELVYLADTEQTNAEANVLLIAPETIITITENASGNERLQQLGFEVITVPLFRGY